MATSTIISIIGAAVSLGFTVASTIVAEKENKQQINTRVDETLKNMFKKK